MFCYKVFKSFVVNSDLMDSCRTYIIDRLLYNLEVRNILLCLSSVVPLSRSALHLYI